MFYCKGREDQRHRRGVKEEQNQLTCYNRVSLGIFSRKPLCDGATSNQREVLSPKGLTPFCTRPIQPPFQRCYSPSAMYSRYNRILDCDAGLGLANTWFPICICICMTPTSWSTALRDSGVGNCPYWQREWRRRGVHTPCRRAGCPCVVTLVLGQHRPTSGLLCWTISAVLNSPGLALHRLGGTAVALALSLSQMFAVESELSVVSSTHLPGHLAMPSRERGPASALVCYLSSTECFCSRSPSDPQLTYTSLFQCCRGGCELGSSGVAQSRWMLAGTALAWGNLCQLLLLLDCSLSEVKPAQNGNAQSVAVESSMPVVSSDVSAHLFLLCCTCIDVIRDAPDPTTVHWPFLPSPGTCHSGHFQYILKILGNQVYFSMAAHMLTVISTCRYLAGSGLEAQLLDLLSQCKASRCVRGKGWIFFFLSPLAVRYLIPSRDSPLPLTCTYIITKHRSFVLLLEIDTVEACSLALLLTLWGKDRKKHWN